MCTPRTVLRLESGEAVQPDAVVGAGLTQLLLGGANLATTTTAAATAWTVPDNATPARSCGTAPGFGFGGRWAGNCS